MERIVDDRAGPILPCKACGKGIPRDGLRVQCRDCRAWFHQDCAPGTKSDLQMVPFLTNYFYVCPQCIKPGEKPLTIYMPSWKQVTYTAARLMILKYPCRVHNGQPYFQSSESENSMFNLVQEYAKFSPIFHDRTFYPNWINVVRSNLSTQPIFLRGSDVFGESSWWSVIRGIDPSPYVHLPTRSSDRTRPQSKKGKKPAAKAKKKRKRAQGDEAASSSRRTSGKKERDRKRGNVRDSSAVAAGTVTAAGKRARKYTPVDATGVAYLGYGRLPSGRSLTKREVVLLILEHVVPSTHNWLDGQEWEDTVVGTELVDWVSENITVPMAAAFGLEHTLVFRNQNTGEPVFKKEEPQQSVVKEEKNVTEKTDVRPQDGEEQGATTTDAVAVSDACDSEPLRTDLNKEDGEDVVKGDGGGNGNAAAAATVHTDPSTSTTATPVTAMEVSQSVPDRAPSPIAHPLATSPGRDVTSQPPHARNGPVETDTTHRNDRECAVEREERERANEEEPASSSRVEESSDSESDANSDFASDSEDEMDGLDADPAPPASTWKPGYRINRGDAVKFLSELLDRKWLRHVMEFPRFEDRFYFYRYNRVSGARRGQGGGSQKPSDDPPPPPPPRALTWSAWDKSTEIGIRDENMEICGANGHRAVRATHGFERGVWYFEVVLTSLPAGAAVRLGLASSNALVQGPVGFDAYSYGVASASGLRFHRSRGEHYCSPWQEGDVIGVLVTLPHDSDGPLMRPFAPDNVQPSEAWQRTQDADGRPYYHHLLRSYTSWYLPESAGFPPDQSLLGRILSEREQKEEPALPRHSAASSSIEYFRNGEPLGVAFTGLLRARLFPAISLYGPAVVRGNFGPVFMCGTPPRGAEPASDMFGIAERDLREKLADPDFVAGELVWNVIVHALESARQKPDSLARYLGPG